jgi:hypothetical protein
MELRTTCRLTQIRGASGCGSPVAGLSFFLAKKWNKNESRSLPQQLRGWQGAARAVTVIGCSLCFFDGHLLRQIWAS